MDVPHDKQLVVAFIALFGFVALLPSVLLGQIKSKNLAIGVYIFLGIGLVSGGIIALFTGTSYIDVVSLKPVPLAWAGRYIGGSFAISLTFLALYLVSLLRLLIKRNGNA